MESTTTISANDSPASRFDEGRIQESQSETSIIEGDRMSRTLSDLYGNLAGNCQASVEEIQSAIASQHLSENPRKYFDSGDYAIALSLSKDTLKVSIDRESGPTLSKAIPIPTVGTQHPKPDTIPQSKLSVSATLCARSSPIKERVISADDLSDEPVEGPWAFTNNNQD